MQKPPPFPLEQAALRNLPGHTVLGLRREMSRLLHRLGTFINMATLGALAKGIKELHLVLAGRSPLLDLLYQALRRKRSAGGKRMNGSVNRTQRRKRQNGNSSDRWKKWKPVLRQKRSADGKKRLPV
jgi:hypothetical protein